MVPVDRVQFVQIAAATEGSAMCQDVVLYALDRYGRVWIRRRAEWHRIENPEHK